MCDSIERQFDEADPPSRRPSHGSRARSSRCLRNGKPSPPLRTSWLNMLLELCTKVSKLAHDAKDIVEPETFKLLDAMDEYQDV